MAWMFIDCATVLCIYTVPVYMTGGEIARDSPIHISSVVAASSAARMNFTAATRAREVLTSRWPRWCTVRSDSTCGGRRISLKPGTSSIGRTLIRQCLRGTRQVSRRKNKGQPAAARMCSSRVRQPMPWRGSRSCSVGVVVATVDEAREDVREWSTSCFFMENQFNLPSGVPVHVKSCRGIHRSTPWLVK